MRLGAGQSAFVVQGIEQRCTVIIAKGSHRPEAQSAFVMHALQSCPSAAPSPPASLGDPLLLPLLSLPASLAPLDDPLLLPLLLPLELPLELPLLKPQAARAPRATPAAGAAVGLRPGAGSASRARP
jgi:hypothetical protein